MDKDKGLKRNGHKQRSKVIITAPSLNPNDNVSGISSVARFIIQNNKEKEYIHFEVGKRDAEHGTWKRLKRLVTTYQEWGKTLRKYPDALIHYNFPLSVPSIIRDSVLIRKAYKARRKIVVHIHGGLFLTAPRIPLLLNAILKRIFKMDLPFIVLSDFEKKQLEERYAPKEVHVLPNCVDLEEAKSFSRHQLPAEKPLTIGYIGRIEPQKGMTELLQACKGLKTINIPFLLKIAGKEEKENDYLPHFREALGDQFSYMGIVSGGEKENFLKSIDILAFPSYFEGLPISLLECMSFEIVPITTPVGSIPQVVKDGQNGLFIEVKDAACIIPAVKKLHENRTLLQQLGHNAQTTIFQNFKPQKYIEDLNNIYQRLLLGNS